MIPKIFTAKEVDRQKILNTVLMGFSSDPLVRLLAELSVRRISFGFMAVFWLIFIAAVLYLILALGGINNSYCSSGSGQ